MKRLLALTLAMALALTSGTTYAKGMVAEKNDETLSTTNPVEEGYFKLDAGVNMTAVIGEYQETWSESMKKYRIKLPTVSSTDDTLTFVGWINSENSFYRAGNIVYGVPTDEKAHDTFTALWSSEVSEAEKNVKEIRVTWDALPKNGSEPHSLLYGSSMDIKALAILEDGTVAVSDKKGVDWSIVSKDGQRAHAVYSDRELSSQKEWSAISLYAPYRYEEKLDVKATSKSNPTVVGTYEVDTVKKIESGNHVFEAGESYFEFNKYEPPGTEATGEAPVFEEVWDAEVMTYSVTVPECSYQIEGLEFRGWYNRLDKKLYQPGENLTVRKFDYSGEWCTLLSLWRDPNPPTAPKKVKISSVKRKTTKKASVKWKKVSDAAGYQLTYSTKSNFKGAKTKDISASKTSYTLKGLTKNKAYYVKIRAYKKDKTGVTIWGDYGSKKKIKKK